MKVDLCDIRRMFRADFFPRDRDITLQATRNFYLGDGTKIDSESNLLPDGAIVLMFTGAVVDIPAGWQLADGTNSTTDLRNMFIVGAGDTYNPGDTGGATTHTHADGSYAAANDTHSHDVTGTSGGGSDHTHGPGNYTTDNDTHSHAVASGHTANNTGFQDVQSGTGASVPTATHAHGYGDQATDDDVHNHSITGGVSAIETSHTHADGSYAAANDTHGHDVTGTSAAGDSLPPYYALCFIMRPT